MGSLAPTKKLSARRRAAGRLFSVHEVATMLAHEPATIVRALEAGSFFPGAWLDDDTWMIPQHALVALLGGKEERLYSIKAFADLLGMHYNTIYLAVRSGRIKSDLVLGENRIPASEYWRLRRKEAPTVA